MTTANGSHAPRLTAEFPLLSINATHPCGTVRRFENSRNVEIRDNALHQISFFSTPDAISICVPAIRQRTISNAPASWGIARFKNSQNVKMKMDLTMKQQRADMLDGCRYTLLGLYDGFWIGIFLRNWQRLFFK
jgi:hypothetical protein